MSVVFLFDGMGVGNRHVEDLQEVLVLKLKQHFNFCHSIFRKSHWLGPFPIIRDCICCYACYGMVEHTGSWWGVGGWWKVGSWWGVGNWQRVSGPLCAQWITYSHLFRRTLQ